MFFEGMFRVYAIFVPSGDQAGWMWVSLFGHLYGQKPSFFVSRVRPEPSAFIAQISVVSSK
jgi:hypothetical protein